MAKKTRKRFTAQEKVAILRAPSPRTRRHLGPV